MRHTGAAVVIALSVLSETAGAQTDDAVDRMTGCSKFEGMARLKCVDELLRNTAQAPDSPLPQDSNWIVSETTSPVDYAPQVAALTMARTSSSDAPSTFAFHCRAHRTELIISTTGFWKQDGEVKVVYRVNQEPPMATRWKSADTGKSLTFPGDAVRMLRSMPDGGHILIKVYAGKAPPYESMFQLSGLDLVRTRIAAACKWR